MTVILKPSGSVSANAQSPHGVSDGSRSSGQPVARTRAAIAVMSCTVETQTRQPSPFLRSRPFAKSSWLSMMSQPPAFSWMPRSWPASSHRSPKVNPSTSRYQAMLFGRSLTVNDAATERSRSDSGSRRCRRGGRFRAAFFFVAMGRLLLRVTSGKSRDEKRSVPRTLPPDYRFDRPTRREIMPTSQAAATWEGKLKDGKGSFKAGSGAFSGPYSFATRFEGKKGTNPEELIAAAHAACFSMALAAGLEKAGKPATRVQTDAACTLEMVSGTPTITRMELKVRGKVPGLDQATFQRAAEEAKTGCPAPRSSRCSARHDEAPTARLGRAGVRARGRRRLRAAGRVAARPSAAAACVERGGAGRPRAPAAWGQGGGRGGAHRGLGPRPPAAGPRDLRLRARAAVARAQLRGYSGGRPHYPAPSRRWRGRAGGPGLGPLPGRLPRGRGRVSRGGQRGCAGARHVGASSPWRRGPSAAQGFGAVSVASVRNPAVTALHRARPPFTARSHPLARSRTVRRAPSLVRRPVVQLRDHHRGRVGGAAPEGEGGYH